MTTRDDVECEDWTWKKGRQKARYDRLYFRSTEEYTVRCVQAEVLRDVWGRCSDHAALLVHLEWSSGGSMRSAAVAPIAAGVSATEGGALESAVVVDPKN